MINTSTKECTIYIDDEVNARIHGLREEHVTSLWEKFGVYVDRISLYASIPNETMGWQTSLL